MNIFRFLVPLLIALLVANSGYTNSFLDDENNALYSLQEMQAVQARLNDVNSRVDAFRDAHGLFRVVRDRYYFGDRGMLIRTKDWFAKSKEWIDEINLLMSALNEEFILVLAQQGGEKESFKVRLSRLAVLLSELLDEGADIHWQITKAKQILMDVDSFSIDFVPGKENVVIEFNEKVINLQENIERIEKEFNGDLSHIMLEILNNARSSVKLMAKQLSLEFPEISNLLSSIDAMIASTEFIDPIVTRIKKQAALLDTAEIQNRPFYGQKTFNLIEEKAASAIQYIDFYVESAEDKQYGKNLINRELAKARANVNRIFNDRRHSIMTRYFVEKLPIFGLACNEKNRANSSINCVLWDTIAGLTPPVFMKMNDDQLMFIETTLDEIEQGDIL